MSVKPFVYGILVLTIFLGTVMGLKAAGIWSVSGKVTPSGEAVVPSGADINEIKGWMTLEQVSAAYHVPIEEILREFSLPADTKPTEQLKNLESESFSVVNLRSWLNERSQP